MIGWAMKSKALPNRILKNYNQWYRIITKDGRVRWLEDRTSVIRDEDGTALFNQGVLVDITETKEAELALEKSEEKYRRIVSTTSEGFILLNEEMVIIDVNQAFCKLLGYPRKEMILKTLIEISSPQFASYLNSNKSMIMENETQKLDGELLSKKGHFVSGTGSQQPVE
jgi:sigma-B regulation protein RsbU (phosphoserine phosphatase)